MCFAHTKAKKGKKIMQGLDLLLGKKPKLIKKYTRRREDKSDINSYLDVIGDAITYSTILETSSPVYKLDYLDDVMELKMEM